MARDPKKRRPPAEAQRASAQRAAEARARIAQAQKRRRLIVVGSAVAAVIVVVGVLIGVRLGTGGKSPESGQQASNASLTVAGRVTSVPAATLDSVGKGSATPALSPTSGTPLTTDGKPEVLYIGAEWCPYCAATRWSLAVALSRFGTLTGLGETASSPSDSYPNTATLTFHGASFTSSTIAFTGKEVQSNQVSGNKYTDLDRLTSAQTKLFEDGGGGFPYLDIAGKYRLKGSPFDPGVLAGKSHDQIATALSDASSPIAKAVDGGANEITAGICQATNNQPASVCSSSAVKAAEA